jgi:hypothetical protein
MPDRTPPEAHRLRVKATERVTYSAKMHQTEVGR